MRSVASAVADGVRSLRAHVCSVGPQRTAPSQPLVVFGLPSGGLRVRGDLQLSLVSTSSLLVAEDELGWVHVHTSWMPQPPAGAPAAHAAAAEQAAAQQVGAAAWPRTPVRRATLGKADVDKVSKDGRFPPDWTLTVLYSCDDDDDDDLEVVEAPPAEAAPAEAAATAPAVEVK